MYVDSVPFREDSTATTEPSVWDQIVDAFKRFFAWLQGLFGGGNSGVKTEDAGDKIAEYRQGPNDTWLPWRIKNKGGEWEYV